MNIGTLSTLVAIVDRGSLTAAARQVGCTPSAVSLQVRQMEAYFGRALFDRSTRTVKPTAFGLEASGFARDLLARLQRLRTERGVAVAGRLRVGVIASIQTDPLPQALRGLRDRHPTLEVAVSLDAIVAMVASGLGATVVPRPRQPLLGTYAVRELGLGRNGPTRQIALVCRDADRDSRSIGAVHRALLEAFG